MVDSHAEITKRLTKAIQEHQTALGAFSAALLSGDTAAQDDAQRRMRKWNAQVHRLSEDLRFVQLDTRVVSTAPRARVTGKTLREQILDVLDEFGVPATPTTVGEFSLATTGIELKASKFASVRRDDERAAKRDLNAKPAWIVPALSTSGLTAMPRLLTSSAWELERRLVGARSLRVIHLRTTLAFLQRLDLLNAAEADVSDLETLLWRYARGIPGAITSGMEPDPKQVRAAVETELTAIEGPDLAERQDAANRLRRYGPQQQLTGLLSVIEGTLAQERVG
jgi:hypothetical protein